MEKFVYSLDENIDKKLLGKKGGNLKQLFSMDIPVPNSIIITTNAHSDYRENGRITREFEKQILEGLKILELKSGKKLGDVENPLLLSIRESTKIEESKTDALINIGLNDNIAANLAVDEKSAKFIYDTYRKLIMMYAKIVKGKNPSPFEILMEKYKEKRNVKNDYELTAEDLFQITSESKKIYRKITGEKFPKDPDHQLLEAIRTIYKNWKDINVAIVIEEMIFANLNDNSYIGIVFSKDPKTGEDKLSGAFSYQVQEKNDNVKTIDTLLEKDIEVYQKLEEYAKKLETKYQDIIRISFIVENGKLYVLDSKKAKKTTLANLNFIVEKVDNGVITKEKAIKMIKPKEIYSLIYDSLSNKNCVPLAKGKCAIPEAITGKICLDIENINTDEKSILFKERLVPEDIKYINNIDSIITAENNDLNELVEEMGRIHVKDLNNLKIDLKNKIVKIEDKIFEEGSILTIDGREGHVYEGALDITKPLPNDNLNRILKMAKEIKKINIITNEIPIESLTDGIGIFKVENTLFDKEKILFIRKILLSETTQEKVRILKDLSLVHIKDLEKLFKISNEKTLTIKLLDIYLRDFLPKTNKEIHELSEILKIDILTLKERLKTLEKNTPLLDLKGSKLAFEYPEIIKIEIETIFKAMINVKKDGYNINPEIILPKVNSIEELKYLKEIIDEVKETVLKNNITYKIGTIIETPRDTVLASSYAKEIDILIFDMPKLTTLTFGPEEIKNNVQNPYETLDKDGVGRLMTVVSSLSHKINPNIKIGTFGKQNEDEESITFLNKIGIENIYILPHQLPATLIAAARSEINGNK
ncbi:MAG: pyruvate, phosphate dikinase [Bacilli bacterium]|nr:pyruvate, phosphate dikinase [Bacilli bacterium]